MELNLDRDIPLDWRECRIPKPKKPGQFRKLAIPNDELKAVQEDILQYLYSLKGIWASGFAFGFVPNRNAIESVARHPRKADIIICMDIKDFFDNFPLQPIRDRLIKGGVSPERTDRILQLCTYKGTVPQGGPCSPWLTNLGMLDADIVISRFAKKQGFTYTRYADDLTFSIDAMAQGQPVKKAYVRMFRGVELILKRFLKLRLNYKKSHVIRFHGNKKRQILGVTISKTGDGYNAPKSMRRTIRAEVCNFANKLRNNGGRFAPEDWKQWMHIKGSVLYCDTVRSYSATEEASTADPKIQARHWNSLWSSLEE